MHVLLLPNLTWVTSGTPGRAALPCSPTATGLCDPISTARLRQISLNCQSSNSDQKKKLSQHQPWSKEIHVRPEGHKQHVGDIKQREKEDSCNTSSLDIFSPAHTGIYKPAFASSLPSPAICTPGLLQTGQGTPHSRVCLSREEIQLQSLQQGLLWLLGGCSSVSCGSQLSLGSCWCFWPAGKGSGPVPFAKARQSSQLLTLAASTIPAAVQGSTAAGSLCEESLAHLETAAPSLLGLL